MSKTIPSLFADTSSADSPFVYNLNTVSRRISNPAITFRFDKGEVGLSLALLTLLQAEEYRRVTFVNFKSNAYITRVDRDGYWLELRKRHNIGLTSGQINAKRFVQDAVRALGHGPGEVISFPVAPFPISAQELGLDPGEYKYPFYRIVKDQKTAKV